MSHASLVWTMHLRSCRLGVVVLILSLILLMTLLLREAAHLNLKIGHKNQPGLFSIEMDNLRLLEKLKLSQFADKNTSLQHSYNEEYWLLGKEQLIENVQHPSRTLSEFELSGNNIMIAIRTTRKFHQKRLPYIYDTWLTQVNRSNVFLVTDAQDKEYQEKSEKLGIHYTVTPSCGESHTVPIPTSWYLCCRTGEVLTLMYRPENRQYDWFCYLDDDVYLILKNLIKVITIFSKNEPAYIGRPGNPWHTPQVVPRKQTLFQVSDIWAMQDKKERRHHFAAGGMYCLSRAMLDKVKPWLVGGYIMGDTCKKTAEPDDVTVGCVVELLGRGRLSRTSLFHHHGIRLSKSVDPKTLKDQIAFAYGCGQLCNYGGIKDNAITVPNAAFSFNEDPSRFRSLHCHLYPKTCKKY